MWEEGLNFLLLTRAQQSHWLFFQAESSPTLVQLLGSTSNCKFSSCHTPFFFFFAFPRKSFCFWQINSLSQEISPQTLLMLSTLRHCQCGNAVSGCHRSAPGWDITELGSATSGKSFQDKLNKIEKWLPNPCLRLLIAVSWSSSFRFQSVKSDFSSLLGWCQELRCYSVR